MNRENDVAAGDQSAERGILHRKQQRLGDVTVALLRVRAVDAAADRLPAEIEVDGDHDGLPLTTVTAFAAA